MSDRNDIAKERDELLNQNDSLKHSISVLEKRLRTIWNDAIEAAAEKSRTAWCAKEAEGRIISAAILTLKIEDTP